MWLPIVLSFVACGVLAVMANLATEQGKKLQVQGAPTSKIVPYALFAVFGGLAGVFSGVFGLYMTAKMIFPEIP